MQCEICGQEIHGKPQRVVIEGAVMLVCGECAKLGSLHPRREAKQPMSTVRPAKRRPPPRVRTPVKRRVSEETLEDMEVVKGFGPMIRRAREGLNLTHEELGKRIGEKVSVLKKVESGKMIPDYKLARKLEHALRIKLLTTVEEPAVPETVLSRSLSGLTLGEVVQLRVKRRRMRDEGDHSPA